MTATLCGLPPELKQDIMIATGSLENIFNVATTCKTMYDALKAGEGIITYTILSQNLDPAHLAIAVAHHAAVKAPWKYTIDTAVPIPADQTAYLGHVTAFCDLYLSKQATELLLQISAFTLPMGFYIEDFSLAVEDMSSYFARYSIFRKISRARFVNLPDATLAELAKIAKAFYILDMGLHLFPRSPFSCDQHRGPDPSLHDQPFNKFWTCFAP